MVTKLAAIDLSASQGLAVLQLLERAKVPPLPAFYQLLYDYIAGVPGLFSSRIGDILADGERDGTPVGDRLYAEFVEPYQNTEALDRAITRITGRLGALDLLIGRSTEASQMQSASLADAKAKFADDHLDVALLRDWVGRLEATNSGMRRVNAALVEELDAARLEIETTQEEISQSKASMALDPLTGLANRAGLDGALARILEDRQARDSPLACAMIDIDHFKSLNDRYGHQVGDEVLRIVARVLLVSVRGADLVGRTGGDEFLVVFPSTDLPTAQGLADRIRSAVVESDLRTIMGNGVLGGISASIGVASFQPGDSIVRLVERADRCLFAAKSNGRNRVAAETELAA